MPKFHTTRITGLTYTLLTTALLLLSLSLTTLVLEAYFTRAFKNTLVQYPGSSLAEWLFVPLNAGNLDSGPMVATLTVGAGSVVTAGLGVAWVVRAWMGIGRRSPNLTRAATLTALLNSAASIGALTYIFVTESANNLPALYVAWRRQTFTREFYVCDALPSLFDNALLEELYGFRACDVAKAAKYGVVGICCLAALLAGLSVLQAYKEGVFRTARSAAEDIPSDQDVEKGIPIRKGKVMQGIVASKNEPHSNRGYPVVSPRISSLGNGSRTHGAGVNAVQRPLPAFVKTQRRSVVGYYEKLG